MKEKKESGTPDNFENEPFLDEIDKVGACCPFKYQ